MLVAYALVNGSPVRLEVDPAGGMPEAALWIDLMGASHEEVSAAERLLSAEIPEPEEAREIEFSSRFYAGPGAVIMTPTLLFGVHRNAPALAPATFLMASGRIATVRYAESSAFNQFLSRAARGEVRCNDAVDMFVGLIEAIIDRLADVIERSSSEVDGINGRIFADRRKPRNRDMEKLIGEIGFQADLVAKARESLSSLERMLPFAEANVPDMAGATAASSRFGLAASDIQSLTDQLDFLAGKLSFLLQATLGLISVEQNEVVRALTVAATILLPPTLIGTFYGMNFEFIPELRWPFGYPLAIVLMLASGLLPLFYFKRRGWL
jgi:magnesium transporter